MFFDGIKELVEFNSAFPFLSLLLLILELSFSLPPADIERRNNPNIIRKKSPH
jgi:hypothetical protein